MRTRKIEIFELTRYWLIISFWLVSITKNYIHFLKYHGLIVDHGFLVFIINPNLVFIFFVVIILPNLQLEPGISRHFRWIPTPISIAIKWHAYMQPIAFDQNTNQTSVNFRRIKRISVPLPEVCHMNDEADSWTLAYESKGPNVNRYEKYFSISVQRGHYRPIKFSANIIDWSVLSTRYFYKNIYRNKFINDFEVLCLFHMAIFWWTI